MILVPQRSTRTYTLFPYTTLYRAHDAEHQGHREAAHRPGAEQEQQAGGDKRRHVGVDDGRVGTADAEVEGLECPGAASGFLADPLVSQDVGVDRQPDRKGVVTGTRVSVRVGTGCGGLCTIL